MTMTEGFMPQRNLADWYWRVGDDTTSVWSSKRAASVPVADAEYVAWAAVPYQQPILIESMDELYTVLAQQAPSGSLPTYCAFTRWKKEQAGITTSFGMPIKTDDRAQAKITGVYAAQQVNPAVATPWHAADGTVRNLTAAEMDAMNVDLLTHINGCFDVSAQVMAGIEAGTITTREQIDAAFAAPLTTAQKNWLKRPPAKAKAAKEE